jgi:urease accessory protein
MAIADTPELGNAGRSMDAPRLEGRVRLRFEQDFRGGSRLALASHQPPLQVVRAFSLADGAALVHLHNLSGGILGGDYLEVGIEVAASAAAQVTTTGATRIYRTLPGTKTPCAVNLVQIDEAGLLEYVPDALIPYAGSRYRQRTRIQLASGSGLFWWEIVAPGRAARGEVFQFEELDLDIEIRNTSRPIAKEHVRLEPRGRPLTASARLGPYLCFASFFICRVGLAPEVWRDLEEDLSGLAGRRAGVGDTLWGTSALAADGLIVRGASRSCRELLSGLIEFWHVSKQKLYGRAPVMPRKVP